MNAQNFAKQDLPKNHQIVEPGSFNTMDHNKDRLKVHVGEDGIVRYVTNPGYGCAHGNVGKRDVSFG